MHRTLRQKKRPLYENHHDFLHRRLTLADIVGGNPEYAFIKTAIYIAILPYITGSFFILIVVAKGSFHDFFTIISKSDWLATIMIWAIGYEVLASLFLGWVIRSLFSLKSASKKDSKKYRY